MIDDQGIVLGYLMRNSKKISKSAFKPMVRQLLPARQVNRIMKQEGPVEHGPRWVTPLELIDGMIYHAVQQTGTLAKHVKELTGKAITDGALSQRRQALP